MASELSPAATLPESDPPPQSHSFFGNLAEYVPGDSIQTYRELFDAFCVVNAIDGHLQWSLMLISLGPTVYEQLRILVHPRKPIDCENDEIWTALEEFYSPRPTMMSERLKFYTAKQQPSETVIAFAERLKVLAETCEFGNFIPSNLSKLREKAIDEALRDQLLVGLHGENVQTIMVEKKSVGTFLSCQSDILFGVKVESALSRTEKDEGVADRNLGVATQSKAIVHSTAAQPSHCCTRCGRSGNAHTFMTCPAKNWKCDRCGNLGHATAMCYSLYTIEAASVKS